MNKNNFSNIDSKDDNQESFDDFSYSEFSFAK